MSHRFKTVGLWTLLALFALGMTACGGGGETADAPGAPADTGTSAPAADTPAAAPSGPAPAGSASISGVVRFEGSAPSMKPLNMGADPGCAAKHSEPVLSEALVLGDGNTMGNVIVTIAGGLPAVEWPAKTEPAVLDQDGCKYKPHVLAVQTGQPIKILNSDGLLHNVHALPKVNKEFNMAMPATRTEAIETFSKAEEPFKIKCDVHPWMGAFVLVSDHPFFSVTSNDGAFSLAGLPAGTYEVQAWHERLGTQTASVTVADGEASTTDFTFKR